MAHTIEDFELKEGPNKGQKRPAIVVDTSGGFEHLVVFVKPDDGFGPVCYARRRVSSAGGKPSDKPTGKSK
ncbi:MAG: hypothetical protein D6706_14940 [Chloroflexi bacterium]|nr:MAG: hypothetical protein D6706_14940 [Chloroflexota bacterium]